MMVALDRPGYGGSRRLGRRRGVGVVTVGGVDRPGPVVTGPVTDRDGDQPRQGDRSAPRWGHQRPAGLGRDVDNLASAWHRSIVFSLLFIWFVMIYSARFLMLLVPHNINITGPGDRWVG